MLGGLYLHVLDWARTMIRFQYKNQLQDRLLGLSMHITRGRSREEMSHMDTIKREDSLAAAKLQVAFMPGLDQITVQLWSPLNVVWLSRTHSDPSLFCVYLHLALTCILPYPNNISHLNARCRL